MNIKGVNAVKKYQNGGYFHEFTCGNCRDEDGFAKLLDVTSDNDNVVLKCKTCNWYQIIDSEWVEHIEKVVSEFPHGVLASFLDNSTLPGTVKTKE